MEYAEITYYKELFYNIFK